MNFVDRNDETALLQDTLHGQNAAFVVIYGRRRIGKTTLIKRVLGDDDVYFMAERSEASHHRRMLAKMLAQVMPDFDIVDYPTWDSLFRASNYRTTKPFTLCLDEFPYMVEQSPELPSVLQKLIDEKTFKYNLIVCGSAQHMMYGLTLDANMPLYGRADAIIKLAPIPLPYLQEALGLNATDAVEEYAVWGGVPRYWEMREKCESLREAIWKYAFSTNAILYDEPYRLLLDDTKDVVKASTIMSYIAQGSNRISEIAARCNEPTTNLSRPIRRLLDLGFVEKISAFGSEDKDSKKNMYKIADSFMDFYYQFVVPNRSYIQLGRKRPIEQHIESDFARFVNARWMSLCRNAVTGNEINGTLYGVASRWWGSAVNERGHRERFMIDMMAKSITGKQILVGECIWGECNDCERHLAELVRKAKLLHLTEGYEIVPMLFIKTPPHINIPNIILPDRVMELLF